MISFCTQGRATGRESRRGWIRRQDWRYWQSDGNWNASEDGSESWMQYVDSRLSNKNRNSCNNDQYSCC